MSDAPSRHVLLMAHGAAESIDQLPEYYTHVRGGDPPPAALLKELSERYRAMGGRSPLKAITASLADQLQRELDRRHDRGAYRVRFGFRHAPPFLEETVRSLLADGGTEILGIVLAPHRSGFVDAGYRRPVEQALASATRTVRYRQVPEWFLEPSFIALEAAFVRRALVEVPPHWAGSTRLCFTAHSLPEPIVAEGDPYTTQLREGARAIAERAGVPTRSYLQAWQSAGRTADRWLGPDLRDVLRNERERGTQAVVVCPHGFVSDHLEILYDIDVEARATAEALGLYLARTEMPNDRPAFAKVLADVTDRWAGMSAQ